MLLLMLMLRPLLLMRVAVMMRLARLMMLVMLLRDWQHTLTLSAPSLLLFVGIIDARA